jgi:hypothetical protein
MTVGVAPTDVGFLIQQYCGATLTGEGDPLEIIIKFQRVTKVYTSEFLNFYRRAFVQTYRH